MLISNLIITWRCCPPKMTKYFPFNIIHNWHLFFTYGSITKKIKEINSKG